MRKNRAIRAPDLRPPTSQRLNRGRLSQSLRPYDGDQNKEEPCDPRPWPPASDVPAPEPRPRRQQPLPHRGSLPPPQPIPPPLRM